MREMSAGFHSEELRAIAGVVETAPFGIDDAIHGVLAQQVDRPEWKYLRNEKQWQTNNLDQGPAGAGRFSGVGIINQDTRTLVVVNGFQCTNTAATAKQIRVGRLPDPTNFDPGVNNAFPVNGMIDLRFLRSGPPVIAFGNTAARVVLVDFSAAELTALNPLTYGFIPSGAMAEPYPPGPYGPLAILHPNSYMLILCAIENLQIQGVIFGYEKPLAQGNDFRARA